MAIEAKRYFRLGSSDLALDLRDARATIARLTAENEALRQRNELLSTTSFDCHDAVGDSYGHFPCPQKAELALLRRQHEALRVALATAKREAWIAGRDAAAHLVMQDEEVSDEDGPVLVGRWDDADEISAAIRALVPPAAEGERPHPDWCSCSQCHPPYPDDPPGPTRPPTTPRARVA